MGEYRTVDFEELMNGGELVLNTPKEEIKDILRRIDWETESENFPQLVFLFVELMKCFPMPRTEFTTGHFVRARRNRFKEGKLEIFNQKTEVSFNRTPSGWGRFNSDAETVFYCSCPISDDPSATASFTANLEVCKEIIDHDDDTAEFNMTISMWEIRKPIILVPLVYHDAAEANSPFFRRSNEYSRNVILRSMNPESAELFGGFLRYLSEKAAHRKPSRKDYMVTTAFYHALRVVYNDDVSLLYSSVQTGHRGTCVVMPNHLVEKGHVELSQVIMYQMKKDNRTKVIDGQPISDYIHVGSDGSFEIELFDDFKYLLKKQ
ncbi:hypothetical protein [Flaviaesturariibacter amylovorans]|uniref:RES domain-containing protein n=1 Tax=Flaviaesturariibacter amylovorans TaxID=1084520 RepID=A0ABP8GP89_9BACT